VTARGYAEAAEAILEGLLNHEKLGMPHGAGMAGKAGFDLVRVLAFVHCTTIVPRRRSAPPVPSMTCMANQTVQVVILHTIAMSLTHRNAKRPLLPSFKTDHEGKTQLRIQLCLSGARGLLFSPPPPPPPPTPPPHTPTHSASQKPNGMCRAA